MGISSDVSAPEKPYNIAHNFNVLNCSILGPSLPMTQVLTPVMSPVELDDEASDNDQHDASESTATDLSPLDGGFSVSSASIRNMSDPFTFGRFGNPAEGTKAGDDYIPPPFSIE